jgi:leader peptidase (prepilin peptidase)/N-methyltransferase
MSPGVIAMFAGAGALAGTVVRPIVFALSVPTGHPLRTRCSHCQAPVLQHRWRSLVAVMWGHCRSCHARIAPLPAVVEVLLGVACALLAYRYSDVWVVLAWWWLAVHGTAIGLIDLVVQRVPNVLTLTSYLGVTVLLATAAAVDHDPVGFLRAVLAGVGLAAFYGLVAVASRGGLGLGDVKLAASLGTALGWAGLGTLIAGTLLGLLLAGVIGLVAITAGRLHWKQHYALGPFLVLGALAALMLA